MHYLATTDPSPSNAAGEFLAAGFQVFECRVDIVNGTKKLLGMPKGKEYAPGEYVRATPAYIGRTNAHLAKHPEFLIPDTDSAEDEEAVRIMEISGLLPMSPRTKTRRGCHRFLRKIPGRENEYPASTKFDKIDLPKGVLVREIVNAIPLSEGPTITPDTAWELFGVASANTGKSADLAVVGEGTPVADDISDDDWYAIDQAASHIMAGQHHKQATIFRVAWFFFYGKGWRDRERMAERCLARNKHPYLQANHDVPLEDEEVLRLVGMIGYGNGKSDEHIRIEKRRKGVHSGRVRLEKRTPDIEEAIRILIDCGSKVETARRLKVSRPTLDNWLKAVAEGRCDVRGGGLSSLYKPQQRDNTFARRKRVKTLLKRGILRTRIAELCGVHRSQITRDEQWIDKHPDTFKRKRKTAAEKLEPEWGKAASLVVEIEKYRKAEERKSRPVIRDESIPEGIFVTALVKVRKSCQTDSGSFYSEIVHQSRQGWLSGTRFVLKDRWTATGKRRHVKLPSVVRFHEHGRDLDRRIYRAD